MPEYRGKSIGLTTLWKIIQRCSGGAGVIALKPYPLQFEHEAMDKGIELWRDKMQLNEFTGDIESATEKLENLYRKLGFVKAKNSSVMYRSNNTRLPSSQKMIDSMKQKF